MVQFLRFDIEYFNFAHNIGLFLLQPDCLSPELLVAVVDVLVGPVALAQVLKNHLICLNFIVNLL